MLKNAVFCRALGSEVIGYKETKIADVEVTKSREKISICTIREKSDTPLAGDKAYQLRKQVKRLVVGQFTYNQSFNRFTKSLQDKLYTTMSDRGIQVIERDQLERVLAEQKLGYSGLINMDSAKKVGELLGAEGILLGSVNDMGNSIVINARLVDIESGNTINAAEAELPKTPLFAQLLDTRVEDKYSVGTGTKIGAPPLHHLRQKKNPFSRMIYFALKLFPFNVTAGPLN